jgi:tRNA1Val (adenine37-N6)-methyltransferase
LSNKAFQFKQFKVEQDRCAMKIGTDAVLMGALLPIDSKFKNALEVGSGTGVISLMIAQRTKKLQIQSVEIDADASAQCKQNFANSPWADRLESLQMDILNSEELGKYDLVFSNPPYFSQSLLSESETRNLARHINQDQFQLWLERMYDLLNDKGTLALVIPAESVDFVSSVLEGRMRIESNIFIRSFPDSEVIRNIISFRKTQDLTSFALKSLSIYEAKDLYSAEYEEALKHYLTIF